jgi:hypothetical protein
MRPGQLYAAMLRDDPTRLNWLARHVRCQWRLSMHTHTPHGRSVKRPRLRLLHQLTVLTAESFAIAVYESEACMHAQT